MRLFATSQNQAQDFADRAHAYLLAGPGKNQFYASSVAAGNTKRWTIPTRDVDSKGQPVGNWYIPVEPRCLGAFTAAELTMLDKPL